MFRAPRPMMRGNTALAHAGLRLEAEPEPELIENIIPIGQRCSLLELDEEKCHWPIGDPGQPEFFFCGGKTGQRHCPIAAITARIAYQPPAGGATAGRRGAEFFPESSDAEQTRAAATPPVLLRRFA